MMKSTSNKDIPDPDHNIVGEKNIMLSVEDVSKVLDTNERLQISVDDIDNMGSVDSDRMLSLDR